MKQKQKGAGLKSLGIFLDSMLKEGYNTPWARIP